MIRKVPSGSYKSLDTYIESINSDSGRLRSGSIPQCCASGDRSGQPRDGGCRAAAALCEPSKETEPVHPPRFLSSWTGIRHGILDVPLPGNTPRVRHVRAPLENRLPDPQETGRHPRACVVKYFRSAPHGEFPFGRRPTPLLVVISESVSRQVSLRLPFGSSRLSR